MSYSDGATAKSAIGRHAFYGDRLSADETKLLMQVHNVVLKAFEVMPLFLVRRDGVATKKKKKKPLSTK
jgi:hypothetical protein